MSRSRRTISNYLAAFLAAAVLHVGLAAVLGDFLTSATDRAPTTERTVGQDTLAVSFYQPRPAQLRSEVTESITRRHEPLPAPDPAPVPDQAVAENPAPQVPPDGVQASELPVPRQAVEAAYLLPFAPDQPQANTPSRSYLKTEKPRPVQSIDAQTVYPLGARLRGEEGAVHILVYISVDGRIDDLEISRSSGFTALDRAAERAVRRTRFKPATRLDQPVAGQLTITIKFSLES